MAQTGTPQGNANSAYAQSFGSLADGTTYSDPANFKGLGDMRETIGKAYDIGLKAQTTTAGGAGTAGYGMIPVYVDPRVIDTTRKFTPLVELIPRVTNQGMTADYNNVTAKGGGFVAAEDGPLAERNNTEARSSTGIKFLYAVGRVTGPSIAAQPSYILAGMQPGGSGLPGSSWNDVSAPNSLQFEVVLQTRALRELEEDLIINGDASVNALQFSGIVKLMGATNTVDKNTSAVSLDDIETAIQYAFDDGGRPNLAVGSSSAVTDVRKLLNAKIGFMQSVKNVYWGFEAIVLRTMVGEVPLLPSMFLSNTSGSKAIYFLDMSVVEMRVLQDVMYEPLAKTNDSQKFMLKVYEALIIRNTAFCSSITEIA